VALMDALCQLWKMDDASSNYFDYLMWDSATNSRKYPELALFKDQTFTENARCCLKMGKCKVNKKSRILELDYVDGSQGLYSVSKIYIQKLDLVKLIGSDQVDIKFVSDGMCRKDPVEDPFHPYNNRWRIRPSHPESEKQIMDRLRGCVHFYSLLFGDVYSRGSREISYSGLPCCFQWYNGGIGVPQELDLDSNWINCFYSEKQALTAYHAVRRIIESRSLDWPEHPTSWVTETKDVLDQIYSKL
jgi:hypothetical protein